MKNANLALFTLPIINEKSDFETFHVAVAVVKGQNDHLPHTQAAILVKCQLGTLPPIVGEWTKCPLDFLCLFCNQCIILKH